MSGAFAEQLGSESGFEPVRRARGDADRLSLAAEWQQRDEHQARQQARQATAVGDGEVLADRVLSAVESGPQFLAGPIETRTARPDELFKSGPQAGDESLVLTAQNRSQGPSGSVARALHVAFGRKVIWIEVAESGKQALSIRRSEGWPFSR
jgi:hypothetical protein